MLKSRKHVFWEALLVTVLIFALGLLVGVSYENSRQNEIRSYYEVSELSLMDMFAFNEMIDLNEGECNDLIRSSLLFADKIYEEARLLEEFGQSDRLTDDSLINHKRYDLLRTFLWINSLKIQERCSENFSVVVYLYQYEAKKIEEKATQRVWSKILEELKTNKQEKIVLIPIAIDTGLASLESFASRFNITSYPVVIIDETHVLTELKSSEDLEVYFD